MKPRLDARRIVVILLVLAVPGCRKKVDSAPPVATPALTLNHSRASQGSPIEITYRFTVANDAPPFAQRYRVLAHVVDADNELMWTDDHDPQVPTTEWKAGQTIEYTRTIFVPMYPYIGEASLQMGLYAPDGKRLKLSGDDTGQRAYRVAKLQILPQTENVFLIFRDGWHPAEIAKNTSSIEWQWSKKEATISFRNPRRDSIFYLDIDNPGGMFKETQTVDVRLGGQVVDHFTLAPKEELIRRVRLSAVQLGAADMVDVKIQVDKTFVPALLEPSSGRDPRELGVRVFHAFVEPR